MKRLISYGLGAALMFATAMPAMAARSWVVCVDENKDARFSTESTPTTPPTPNFFVAAAPVYPGNTVTSTATTDCSPTTVKATQVGTFFTIGGFVNGLPGSGTASTADLFLVLWHFRITGKGAFDTTGPVRSTATYGQTIIGSTNPGLVPTHGTATVTAMATGTATTGALPLLAFKITTP
jgi:hypothetical protein